MLGCSHGKDVTHLGHSPILDHTAHVLILHAQSALLPVLSTLLPIPSQKPGQMRLQEGRFSWLQAPKSSMAPDTASLSSTGQCPPSHHLSLPPDYKPQEGSHHDRDVLLTAVRTRLEPSASAVCSSDLTVSYCRTNWVTRPRQEPSVDWFHSLKHQWFGTDHGPQCLLGNVTSEWKLGGKFSIVFYFVKTTS